MATKAELQSLLERAEAATGPDRYLDAKLWDMMTGTVTPHGIDYEGPQYTASIDAALALVERMLPAWTHGHQKFPDGEVFNSGGYQFFLAEDDSDLDSGYASGEAQTLPLAILAALLRALIAQADEVAA